MFGYTDDMDDEMNPLAMIMKIQGIIAKNQDLRTKEVGDRVIVWDGTASENFDNPEKHYSGVELCDHECIVAQTGVDYIYTYKSIPEHQIHLDIVVWSPKFQTKIRTSSNFVGLVGKL